MLVEKTKANPGKILDFKMTKPSERLPFDRALILAESNWLVDLTNLEISISVSKHWETWETFLSSPMVIGLIL